MEINLNGKKDVTWYKTDPTREGGLLPPSYEHDAGFDLIVSEALVLGPKEPGNVACGCRIALPEGVSAVVIPRSSTARRNLLVYSTLIDSGYRGDLFVFVFNLSNTTIIIQPGDRIAQLLPILTIADHLELRRVYTAEDLPPSKRGINGFGSSGR
jgi:dUTP pyrophosphatase